jgi:hypothetical protein
MEMAVREFKTILTDTNALMGWSIPTYVIEYESRIFASKLEQPNWQPEPSYAERYLSIRTREQALDLANTCWFTRSIFPELGTRRGIKESYYVQLGQSCYDRVLQGSESRTVETMRDHFEFLAETAYTAIRHYGKFRSMWE